MSLGASIARALRVPPETAEAVLAGEPGDSSPARSSRHPQLPAAIGMFDPVGIQDLVLRQRRPIGILGASKALEDWGAASRERAEAGGVALAYHGGGVSVVLGLPDAVNRWCAAEEGSFRQALGGHGAAASLETTVGDLATGARPYRGPVRPQQLEALGIDPSPAGFGPLLSALVAKVSAAKNRCFFSLAGHDGPRCRSSGVFAAPAIGEDSREFTRFAEIGRTLGENRWTRRRAGSLGDLPGGVAYVQIDGTGIGAELQKLASVGAYATFSDALRQAFDLRRHLEDLGVARTDWIQIVGGGDDLTFAVAGGVRFDGGVGPFELVIALLAAIEEGYDAAIEGTDLPRGIGAGAGLVVGDGITAKIGLDLAKALMKGAKKLQRKPKTDPSRPRSVIDFAYLQKGGAVDFRSREDAKVRTWRPPNTDGDVRFRLGRSPYSVAEARALAETAAEVVANRDGARLLYQLRSALEEPAEGLILATYLLAAHGRSAWGPPPGSDPKGWDTRLVRPGSDSDGPLFVSAIPDLVEIATFRRRAGRAMEAE